MKRPSTLGVPNLLKGRSIASNDALRLDGVDLRSSVARRFRDLVVAYSADLGGVAKLTEAERALVRQAASLTIRAERLQAEIVRGDVHVDADEVVRLSSETRRCLQLLEGRRARAEEHAAPSLHAYLAARGSAA